MKRTSFFFLILLPLLWSCADDKPAAAPDKSESDVDAARMFIRSALDGKWKEARSLVIQDPQNLEDLDVAEQNYTKHYSVTDQRGYRESTIRIYDTRKVSDSISIITYSNTYRNQKDSVKVAKVGGTWLVDLKFTFPNNHPQ